MKKDDKKEIRIKNIVGQPSDSFDMVNKYGTYEIQPTADSDNEFPKIAQGLPKKKINNPNSRQPK